MVDRLTPERRSALMSRVRGKNTGPEIAVRRSAHSLGLRFRLHDPTLPGKPDLVFKRHKKIILVHGCFWHRHKGCKKASTPKSKTEYWIQKFRKNVERDKIVVDQLNHDGWKVLTVWECQTKLPSELEKRISKFFEIEC